MVGRAKKEPTELILGGAQPGYSRRHLAADVSQNVYEIVGRGDSWGEGPRTAGRPAGPGQAHSRPADPRAPRGPQAPHGPLGPWGPWGPVGA